MFFSPSWSKQMPSLAAPDAIAFTLSSAQPFPGLRPYEEVDADWFFGRSGEINELLKRLRRVRFIAIVGPSGCGKSSVIRAGVLPALRDGYLDSSWSIATFRPGEQPLDNLARSVYSVIASDVGDHQRVRKLLDSGPMGLIKAIQAEGLSPGGKLLVLVDQFEELFQFAQRHGDQSQEEVKAFLKLLLAAAGSNEIPFYLVLTMRMEWLSECSTYVGLAEAINEGIYLVPQMSRRQFQQVILDPIDTAHEKITTNLLDRMLNDLGGRSDQLPVLQHALMRLWERRRPGEPIDIPDYEAVGTCSNCLSDHAEEVFAELSAPQKKVAELLFRSITQVYKNRKIRRPRAFRELAGLPGMSAVELKAVIEAFRQRGRSFLFTSEGPLEPDSVIDISHEALMRQWTRLNKWVEEEAEVEARLGRLREDAAEWDRNGRKDRSALYSGYRLQKVEELRPLLQGADPVLDFLIASRKSERWTKIWRRGFLFLPLLLIVVIALGIAYERAIKAQRLATESANEATLARSKAEKFAADANREKLIAEEQTKKLAASTQVLSNLNGKAVEAAVNTQSATLLPRVYMQIVNENDRDYANQIKGRLTAASVLVLGIEYVPRATGLKTTEVRYYSQADAAEAQKILGVLKDAGEKSAQVQYLGLESSTVRPNHFEVWIASRSVVDPDRNGIKQALERWKNAYESESLDDMKRAWPSISRDQQKKLKDTFDTFNAIKVVINYQDQDIRITGGTAEVTCQQSMRYTFKGRVQPEQVNTVNIKLSKQNDGTWAVASVSGS
jgi:hypothetical protein